MMKYMVLMIFLAWNQVLISEEIVSLYSKIPKSLDPQVDNSKKDKFKLKIQECAHLYKFPSSEKLIYSLVRNPRIEGGYRIGASSTGHGIINLLSFLEAIENGSEIYLEQTRIVIDRTEVFKEHQKPHGKTNNKSAKNKVVSYNLDLFPTDLKLSLQENRKADFTRQISKITADYKLSKNLSIVSIALTSKKEVAIEANGTNHQTLLKLLMIEMIKSNKYTSSTNGIRTVLEKE